MTGQLRSLFSISMALAMSVGLAGCGGAATPSLPSVSDVPGASALFGSSEQPPLEGKRISVLSSGSGDTTSSVETKEPVILPKARANESWTQPGGVASNSPGHLAFSGSAKPVWNGDIGSGSNSEGKLIAVPIVAAGKVFTLDREGIVTAFSVGSGKTLWSANLQPEGERAEAGFGGGLAADGDRLYAATGFGTLTALNISSGKQLWTKPLGVPIRTSPTAADGKVYVVNSESELFALSGADGQELWTARGLPEGASILSNVSPALSGNMLVVSYPSGEVTAFDVTSGEQRWTDSVSGGVIGSSLTTIGDAARPVIDDGVVFAGSQAGRMIATVLKTGERVWSKDIRVGTTPWVAGSTVFVVDTSNRIYALDRKTGKARWVMTLPEARLWSGPTLAGGKLWIVSDKGLLVNVDAKSGQLGAKVDLGDPVFIPPVVANGRMFVLTDDASLIAMN